MDPAGETQCPICNATFPHHSIVLKERMFGLGHEFKYLQCSNCETLRIEKFPENIGDYYQEAYHGHMAMSVEHVSNSLRRIIIRERDRFELTGKGMIGKIAAKKKEAPDLRAMRPLRIRAGESILDVGCGYGRIIARMQGLGVTAHGVDPFIDGDIGSKGSGFWVRKGFLTDIEDTYDMILMNHSFEHMPDPLQVLKDAKKRLKPTGRMMLRIPTISCQMWSEYGVCWYQLDAPRHFFLHSRSGIRELACQAELEVTEIIDDSDEYQFIGSELYRAGVALYPSTPEGVRKKEALIAGMDRTKFRREAEKLNREGRGDQIAVLLKHKST